MNKLFRQKSLGLPQRGNDFSAILRIINRIVWRMATLLYLTEEEQKDAGICYPGDQRTR